jgi:hypothetical protein
MPYTTGTATSYLDLLDKLRRYACGFGTAAAPVAGSNTGNGTCTGVDTTAATVTETWTLTCTAGGATGTFSVTGSVSGAQAAATVGTPYSNTRISFTLNDGSADFIIGDSFTIATTRGALATAGEEWEQLRWTGGNELILRGQGLSGAEEIYVGLKTYFDAGNDYYNWECRGFRGFLTADPFASQPGTSRGCYLPLWNSSTPYWFVVNGDCIIVVAKVSTVYQLAYLGRVVPYGQPGAYPYPVLIAASTGVQATRWSATADPHSNLTRPRGSSSTSCGVWGHTDGTWVDYTVESNSVFRVAPWPWQWHSNYASTEPMTYIDVNPDGSYTLEPAQIVMEAPALNLLGELHGVAFVTGQSNAAENIITAGGADWLVVPNIYRSSRDAYCAIKLA